MIEVSEVKKMRRLPEMLQQEIELEIAEGTSLNAISNSYNIGKSTLYYYYKKIKGKKFVPPNVTPVLSEETGEILGIFAGDGSQYFEARNYHYEINVHFGHKKLAYANYVKALFEGFFKKKFRLQRESHELRLRTYSKEIFYFFNNFISYNPKIKHSTVKLISTSVPANFKIGFLRGLFDTDGSILYIRKQKRVRIAYCTTSLELMRQVKSIMDEFGLKYGVYTDHPKRHKDIYRMTLWKESNNIFLNTIEPFKKRLLLGR
ncbi:hypothetical protein HYV85_05940 [Candidatus Woesearchaeota archaeon]|nr:hypothetical protein [Candidatus Woesearchaeota archaeon]